MGLVKPTPETPAPVVRSRPSQWPAALDAVEKGRGKWMRVAEYDAPLTARTVGSSVRKKYDPAGRFQFTARAIDGRGVLYARLRVEGGK